MPLRRLIARHPALGPRHAVVGILAIGVALTNAPAAAANGMSQNWSGYAAYGATFESVSARWRQPTPICTKGKARYSAMWVGLGGYRLGSGALEQIGTELDCSLRGHAISTAWYELIPANSHTISMKVRPGDLIAASVSIDGHQVTVAIDDLTSGRSFRKTLSPSEIDASSAEWILEAPSACYLGATVCKTLPLTDFHRAMFTDARAQTLSGQVGTIANPGWSHTKITLGPGGTEFVSDQRGTVAVGTAKPSGLIHGGSSFRIAYRQKYVKSTSLLDGPRFPTGPLHLTHPGLF